MTRRGLTAAIVTVVVLATGAVVLARTPESGSSDRMRLVGDNAAELKLDERLRLGAESDSVHSFGRIMDVAVDTKRRLWIADDLNHRVAVYGPDGRLLGHAGRQGEGPGEFQTPWKLAIDASDSVFVWDMNAARISVFDPDMKYARAFRVPPQWLINAMRFLPSGNLVVASVGGVGDSMGVRIIDRQGSEVRSFAPVQRRQDLLGFEASLLGGALDVLNGKIIYTRKSPYEILTFDESGSFSIAVSATRHGRRRPNPSSLWSAICNASRGKSSNIPAKSFSSTTVSR